MPAAWRVPTAAASRSASGRCSIPKRELICPPPSAPWDTVFQTLTLFPHLSVEDNVAYGLAGRVRALEKLGHRVEAGVDCGAEFRVDLTTAACAELDLAPGREVWLALKTYSCHLVR